MKKLEDCRTSHTRDTSDNISIGEYTYGTPMLSSIIQLIN